MGMAKTLKGKQEGSLPELAEAMAVGIAVIMEKAKSKPGEKTILDALYPAVTILKSITPIAGSSGGSPKPRNVTPASCRIACGNRRTTPTTN